MKTDKPTNRQARLIARALNAKRDKSLPPMWARLDEDGDLYIGADDSAERWSRARTWAEAQELLANVRAGHLTA